MSRNRLVRIGDSDYEVVGPDPPPNLVALKMAGELKDAVRTGLWLILLVAVWSAPDIDEIDRAVRLASQWPAVMVGVRVDSVDDVRNWLPTYAGEVQGPLWIVMKGGVVHHALVGLVADGDLKAALGEADRP